MRLHLRVIAWMRSAAASAVSLKSCIRPRSLCVSLLLILAAFASVNETYGQRCRPAILRYIVRDEKGRNLSEAELQAVHKQMSQPANGVSTVSFTEDGNLVRDYTEAKDAKIKLSALYYVDIKTCELNVGEVTLQQAGKTMRLIFNMKISRRTFVVDSLPFQSGTFELDQKALSKADPSQVIPAKEWKKINDNP